MRDGAFETATRGPGARRRVPTGAFARYGPHVIVSMLVMILLAGGALYTARLPTWHHRLKVGASWFFEGTTARPLQPLGYTR